LNKRGLETYISLWKKGIDKGHEQYWHPEIIYWEAIYKALDTPFQSIGHSTTNFWPSTMHEIRNNAPIKSSHEVMEAYLRKNVPKFEDFYIGPLCNKHRDPFSSKSDVVERQMFIIQSLDQDCVIWLAREKNLFMNIQLLLLSLKN